MLALKFAALALAASTLISMFSPDFSNDRLGSISRIAVSESNLLRQYLPLKARTSWQVYSLFEVPVQHCRVLDSSLNERLN